MTELEKRKTLASKFAIAPDATAEAPATATAPANATANATDQANAQATSQANAQAPAQATAQAPANAPEEFDPEGTGEANYNTSSGAVAVAKDINLDKLDQTKGTLAMAERVAEVNRNQLSNDDYLAKMKELGFEGYSEQELAFNKAVGVLDEYSVAQPRVARTKNDVKNAVAEIIGGAPSSLFLSVVEPLFDGDNDILAKTVTESFNQDKNIKLKQIEDYINNPNVSVEDKKIFLEVYGKDIVESFSKTVRTAEENLREQAITSIYTAEMARVKSEEEKQAFDKGLVDVVKNRLVAIDELNKLKKINSQEVSGLDGTLAIADLFIPFQENVVMGNLITKLEGKNLISGYSTQKYINGPSLLADITEKAKDNPKVAAEFAKTLREFAEENKLGLVSDKNFITIADLTDKVANLVERGESVSLTDIDSMAYYLATGLDSIPILGTAVKGVIKGTSTTIKGLTNILSGAKDAGATEKVASITRQMLTDPVFSDTIGVEKKLIAKELLLMRPDLLQADEADLDLIEGFLKEGGNILSASEKTNAAINYKKLLDENQEKLLKNGVGYRADTIVEATDIGLVAKSIITKNGSAFETEAQAIEFNQKSLNGSGEVFEKDGAYLVKTENLVSYSAATVKLAEASLDVKDLGKTTLLPDYANLPETIKPIDMLKRHITTEGANNKMVGSLNKAYEPFFNSSKKAQSEALKAAENWYEDGKNGLNFYKETLSPEGYKAFETLFKVNKAQYYLSNMKKRSALVNEGYLEIGLNIEKTAEDIKMPSKLYGKPLQALGLTGVLAKKPVRVMDDSGAVIDLTKEMLDNGVVYRLDSPMQIDGKTLNHVYINATTTAKVSEIGVEVLPFGRIIPRVYEKNIFVEWLDEAGEKHPVAAFETSKEADDWIKSQENPNDYLTRFDRALTTSESRKYAEQIDMLENSGSFKARGKGLTDAKGTVAVTDSLKVLQKATRVFANHFSIGETVLADKERFVQAFGKFLKADENGQIAFPESLDYQFLKSLGQVEGERVPLKEMERAFEIIKQMEGQRKGLIIDGYKDTMLRLTQADFVQRHPVLQKMFFGAAKSDPSQALRNLTSMYYIRLNPARQFFLQTTQALYLAGAYPASILSRENTGLLAGISTRASAEVGAKMVGVSVEDYKGIMKVLADSGLYDSIKAHTVLEEATTGYGKRLWDTNKSTVSNVVANTFDRIAQAISFVPKAGGAVGFEAGEHVNLTLQFLVAKDRLMATEKYAGKSFAELANTKSFVDDIRYAVREQTHFQGMQVAKPRYQEGAMGTVLQYFSVGHKAMTALLPEKLGGFVIGPKSDPRLKASYIVSSLGMFGLDGVGLMSAYDRFAEVVDNQEDGLDPELNNIIRNGLLEVGINKILGADIDLSGQAYLAQTPLNTLTSLVFGLIDHAGQEGSLKEMQKTLSALESRTAGDFVAGAFFNVGKSVITGIGEAIANLNSPIKDLNGLDNFLQSIAGLTPIGKNILIAFQESKLNAAMTSQGAVMVEGMDTASAVARAFLGIKTNSETEIFRQMEGMTPIKLENDLMKDGAELYKTMKQRLFKYEGVSITDEAFQKGINEMLAFLPHGNTPEEYYIREGFLRAALNDTNADAISKGLDRYFKNYDKQNQTQFEKATENQLVLIETAINKYENAGNTEKVQQLKDYKTMILDISVRRAENYK